MRRKTYRADEAARERELLEDAVRAFEEVTAIRATVVASDVPLPGGRADAELTLDEGELFLVEVKRSLTPATLGPVLAQLKQFRRPVLLVTPYVTSQLAERLKLLDAPFLDAAGNAYLRTPGKLIYVVGRKPEPRQDAAKPVRAFRPTGLRVVFALLAVRELAGAPYRTIAEQAGVALGTVNGVVADLERLGFLVTAKSTGRRLERRSELIDAWVEAYHRELRPRLNPRRFRVMQPDWWQTEDLGGLDLWLGGEPAAALLTGHLRPEVATLYSGAHFSAFARRVHPTKDEHGNLEVLDRFWKFEPQAETPGRQLAPPLLVYADLVGTGDPRNAEAAEIVRERFLV
ncbi:MAG: hypothetical protein HY900_06980 [Deltaproteobacteria bacterium]|nr:hypothetical protein [Deltaproteobacteria bacterium]